MDINPYLSAVRALRALVEHDMAADYREGLEHCPELQRAIEILQRLDRTEVPKRRVQGLSREGNVEPKMFHGEDPQDVDP